MNYRFLIIALNILLLSFNKVQGQSEPKPNIILIIADDLGWGDVGFHGSDIRTPHIDKLSEEGIILDRFYTCPICSPTRAGLLTGRYPSRYGIRNNVIRPWLDFGLDTTEVLLPEILAQAGYNNRALIGKWHLGHSRFKYHPLKRGFTYFYGHLNGAIDYFKLSREGEKDWFEAYTTSTDSGYSTDLITAKAIQCIKEFNNDDSPFFLQVAYNAPHSPLQAQEKYLRACGFDPNKPKFLEGRGRGNTKRQTYAAMVLNMDDGIGQIFEELETLGIEDNTIILFMSDNGAATPYGGSSGELRGRKLTEWDGGVRVPAIIKWEKGFKGGYKLKQLTGYIDVFPTILSLIDFPYIGKNNSDGIDISTVLTGQEKKIEREIFIGNGVLVNEEFKLILKNSPNKQMDHNKDLLFKIKSDPSETTDVLPQYPDVFERMNTRLDQYSKIPSSFPAPNDKKPDGFKPPTNWSIKD